MLSKPILKLLIKKYLVDANVLLANRRYSAAIYLSGYALELALKYGICRIMLFGKGFPETRIELDRYLLDIKKKLLRRAIKDLRDIRHHKLSILLQHSGEQYNIERNFSFEWDIAKSWKPEVRYEKVIVRKSKCREFLNSVERIVNNII